jgi:hypothetical protein
VNGDLPSSWRTVCGVRLDFIPFHHELNPILYQTNDVLFPKLGGSSDAKHQESPTRGLRLSTPVIALACAMGFALVALAVSYVRGLKTKMASHAIYFTNATSEKNDEEQGSRVNELYPEKSPVPA